MKNLVLLEYFGKECSIHPWSLCISHTGLSGYWWLFNNILETEVMSCIWEGIRTVWYCGWYYWSVYCSNYVDTYYLHRPLYEGKDASGESTESGTLMQVKEILLSNWNRWNEEIENGMLGQRRARKLYTKTVPRTINTPRWRKGRIWWKHRKWQVMQVKDFAMQAELVIWRSIANVRPKSGPKVAYQGEYRRRDHVEEDWPHQKMKENWRAERKKCQDDTSIEASLFESGMFS